MHPEAVRTRSGIYSDTCLDVKVYTKLKMSDLTTYCCTLDINLMKQKAGPNPD